MFRNYSRRPLIAGGTYYANEIGKLYNFPAGDGSGQTIGIIELGGGYELSDIHAYAQKLNLPPINITAVSVDGAVNVPGQDPQGADGEVALDIQVIYAIAPKAAIRVYFAPNTDQGFLNAISKAIADKVNVISISWGGAEDMWNSNSITAFEAVFEQAAKAGITVLAAAGDNGYEDDPNVTTPTVDYPASSPYVTACGGTQHTATAETVWDNLSQGEGAGGGGMSKLFARPAWQTADHINKVNRCVPDISGNASPVTGYNVIVDGQWTIIGGTSAVAPLYAALVALINQKIGKNVGYLNPAIYKINSRSLVDILSGGNGWFVANVGYDLVSGLGRIDGANIISDIEWALNHE